MVDTVMPKEDLREVTVCMRLTTKFNRGFERIHEASIRVAASLLALMMVLVLIDISARLLWRPITGILEIVECSLVLFTFAGCAWVLWKDGHVKLDIMLGYMGRKTKAWVGTAVYGASSVMFLSVTWFSIGAAITSFHLGYLVQGVLGIPKWIFLLAIGIGSLLLSIESARKAYQSQRLVATRYTE